MEEIMKSGVQYVYVYWIDGIPRYVGNGKGKRILDHLNNHQGTSIKLKELIKSSSNVKYEIISSGSQEEMDVLERELIQKYGRLVDGGTLINNQTGGKKGFKQDQTNKIGSHKHKFAESHFSTKQKYQQLHPITGEVIAEFIGNHALESSGFQVSNVHYVCQGKRKSHKGFKWRVIPI